jgi:tRNA A-37 threonylcarbamoyl transferase component Bud32
VIGNQLDTHPSSDQLAAFALGRLDDKAAIRIADHLGSCETCQQAIRAVPDDSVLSLLRPSASTPISQPQLLGVTTCEDIVPAELRGHARYRVLRRLGAGGMGVVYLCEHRLMRKTVALKMINKELTVAPGMVERFLREVEAAARLAHPNLVQAFDADKAGELHFLVLEFIDGVTLDALVKRDGPLPVERACNCVRQAALGLAHAAGQGLVHRDVKPQNIMVTAQGQVKVMDFGLASLSAERAGEGGLTETGQGLGTPDYMAPEQIRDAHTADARADTYSLGGTLYFLLTGRPPFPEGNAAQKVAAHLERQPEPLSALRPEVPAGLVQVIAKMMAKDPAQRYQTAAAVVAALEPWCPARNTEDRSAKGVEGCTEGGPGTRAPRQEKRWAVAAVLLGLVVVVASLVTVAIRWKQGPELAGVEPPPAGVLAVAEKPEDGGRFRTSREAPDKVEPGKVPALDPPDPKPPAVDPPGPEPEHPAPNLSKVMPLLDDDFRDPDKSHFPTFHDRRNDNKGSFEKDRGYVLRRPRVPNCMMGPCHAVEGDFACRVVGRIPLKGGSGWGIDLYTPGDPHHLVIRLRNDGAVEIGTFVWNSGMWTALGEPIRHPAIHSDGKPNTLLVLLRGGQALEVYVNGTAVTRPIQLEHPLVPRVAQDIGSWAPEAEFTRFTVWLLSPSVPGEGDRPPDLSKAEKVIEADFGDPKKRYFTEFRDGAKGFEHFFEKGSYVLRLFVKRSPANWGTCGSCHAILAEIAGDLACQVEGRVLTEGDNGWALGLLTPDGKSDVAVRLRRDGAVEVGNFLWGREAFTTVGPIRHPAIHPGGQSNTLLVVLRGGQTLEIYVNGRAVTGPIRLKQRLESVCPAVVAWERCGHAEMKTRVEFSHFTVWRLPPSAETKP